jgi:predicted AAA+ superfamily ATPase
MALPTVYDICVPRDDVLQGSITESDFAADLAQILRGDAPEEYTDPVKFFANTYPTRGAEGLTGQCLPSLSALVRKFDDVFTASSGKPARYLI